MPEPTAFAQKRSKLLLFGEECSRGCGRFRIARLGAVGAIVLLVSSVAHADPFQISLHPTNAGISSIDTTVNLTQELPDGRQIFEIAIQEDWRSLLPGVLTFSNFPERSILDITKMAANGTGTEWTSFANLTQTDDANVPPFGILFEASEADFFSIRASWQLSASQLARCREQFATICDEPFRGNAFTFRNGRIAAGETGRIRFAVQMDRGDFTLTQTPDAAPVPEPSTFVLFGTAAVAAWRTRRRSARA